MCLLRLCPVRADEGGGAEDAGVVAQRRNLDCDAGIEFGAEGFGVHFLLEGSGQAVALFGNRSAEQYDVGAEDVREVDQPFADIVDVLVDDLLRRLVAALCRDINESG